MNVALFGGSFDPVHRGHLAVARAAQRRYKLERIYFVPTSLQPLKQGQPTAAFADRYAMLALATRNEKRFLPSLLEAPDEKASGTPNYTIDTVRRFRAEWGRRAGARRGAGSDRLFFLIGADSFLSIGRWHKSEELLREVEFIIATRPGFPLKNITEALPASLRAQTVIQEGKEAEDGKVALHLLRRVNQDVSATAIREAAARGQSLKRWLDPAVAGYIAKTGLYRTGERELG